MNTTLREFTRKLPVYRRAAMDGKAVSVRDREGNVFTFARKQASPKTLAEAVGHLAGIASTGVAKKSLRGYGKR